MDWVYSTDQMVLFGNDDGAIRLWNVASKKVVSELTADQRFLNIKCYL